MDRLKHPEMRSKCIGPRWKGHGTRDNAIYAVLSGAVLFAC